MIVPQHVLPTWRDAASYVVGGNGTGWANLTGRSWFASSEFSRITGSAARVSFVSGTGGNMTITNAYIGVAGTAPSFATTPTRLTFSGSNGITIPSGNNTAVSDAVQFWFDPTQDHIVSFETTTNNNSRTTGFGGGVQVYFKSGADAATVNVSGYTMSVAGGLLGVSRIEVLS